MTILISAIASLNLASSSVTTKGNEFHVITDPERQTFQINDIQLKNAVAKYFGQAPTDAFVKSSDSWPDSSWADLYSRYNWSQVTSVMEVQDAKVIDISSKPVIIASRFFQNKSTKPVIFTASITENVANTIESNWSSSQSVTAGLSFTEKVEIGIEGFGKTEFAPTQIFSMTDTWGKGGSSSQTTTVGSTTGLSITLNSGEAVTAHLIATRGTMKVKVNYKIHLTGDTAVNYEDTYQGHNFWALPIEDVMSSAGIPNYKIVIQDIDVGYYSDAYVIVLDRYGVIKAYVPAVLSQKDSR
jgi:hypothetical protein